MINSPFILQILIFSILFSMSLLVMLILFICGRRYLSSIDIELYGGLSSRFLILVGMFVIGTNTYKILYEIPFYGFIAPIESYIILDIGILLSNYIGFTSLYIYDIIIILSSLSMAMLYLYLIFVGKKYQEKAVKVYYLIVVILGSITLVGGLGSRFQAYVGVIQIPFVLATLVRWLSNLIKEGGRQVSDKI